VKPVASPRSAWCWAASFGATAWFGELRYERWLQHGVRHHDLPANLFAAVVGFTSR
jgi:hypothetical protein